MDAKQIMWNRINKMSDSVTLQNEFASTSLANKKRVYTLFNANIKTINTYSKYLSEIKANPNDDHHQKYAILRQLRVLAGDDTDKIEIEHRNNRAEILLKAYDTFHHRSSFFRMFITFIIAMNSDYSINDSSQYLIDTMPSNMLDNYDSYLREILKDNISLSNPAFGIFVLYSDPDLLDAYLDYYVEDESGFELDSVNLEQVPFIIKRITNCQKSALKSESVLFCLYNLIESLDIEGKEYDEIIEILVSALKQKMEDLNYKDFSDLYKFEDNGFIDLKEFFLNLSEKEKDEILLSLGNEKSMLVESKFKKVASRSTISTNTNYGKGYDADTRSKSRRGQARFKRNLLSSLNGRTPKCSICGCEICGSKFLVASHIVPWKFANQEEKVDPNNGLLLCPNHDFLFDSLLISFDENGEIMVSETLSQENKRGFRINKQLKVDLSPEKEVYMNRHRNAFMQKRWK